MNISKLMMKCVLALVVCGMCGVVVAAEDTSAAEYNRAGLSVELYPGSQDYTLGELVKLRIRITNRSNQEIRLQQVPSVENGLVHVLMAAGSEGFKKYEGPGWGIEDSVGNAVELAPGEFIESKVTILYNHRRETKHLSELYAKQITKEFIDSDYAFVRPGTYRVKVIVAVGGVSERVESEPRQVRVNEPTGSDLQVWKVLKSDARLGYFLQRGTPMGDPRSSTSLKQAEVLEALASAYPEGRNVDEIRASLAKYDKTLQKLRELKLIQE